MLNLDNFFLSRKSSDLLNLYNRGWQTAARWQTSKFCFNFFIILIFSKKEKNTVSSLMDNLLSIFLLKEIILEYVF